MEGQNVLELTEVQKCQIKQLMELYPKLDYLMASVLVTTPSDKLDEIFKDAKVEYKQPQSTLIKDAFHFEN